MTDRPCTEEAWFEEGPEHPVEPIPTPPPPGGCQYLFDYFDDLEDTPIGDHTPNADPSGLGWTQDLGAAGQAYIESYGLLLDMNTGGGWGGRAVIDSLLTELQFSVVLTVRGDDNFVWARIDPGDASGMVYHVDQALDHLRVSEIDDLGATFPVVWRPRTISEADVKTLAGAVAHNWHYFEDHLHSTWLNWVAGYHPFNYTETVVGLGERLGNSGPRFNDLCVRAPPDVGLLDEFTGPNGQSLAVHLPDVNPMGGPWLPWAAVAPLPTGDIQGNRARVMDIGDGNFRGWEIDTGKVDQMLIMVRFFGNPINPGAPVLTFRGRSSGYPTERHWFWLQPWTNQLCYRLPTGTTTCAAGPVLNPSDEVWLVVKLDGNWISMMGWNATTGSGNWIQQNNAAGLDGSWCGIGQRTVFGGGTQDFYDNFLVQDLPVPVP